MCFSAGVSYAAAGGLLPLGVGTLWRSLKTDHRYLGVAALPLLFGAQQLAEGMLWSAATQGRGDRIQTVSLIYMFFTWFVWPVWVPFAAYFLESCKRRYLYLVFSILGGIVGAMQFIPYFAHDGWLVVRFLSNAISYEGTVLFDLIMPREVTYAAYLFVVIIPLLTSSERSLKIFGLLVVLVLAITYAFFRYAYISVFCFGGAVMSLYLVWVVFNEAGKGKEETAPA